MDQEEAESNTARRYNGESDDEQDERKEEANDRDTNAEDNRDENDVGKDKTSSGDCPLSDEAEPIYTSLQLDLETKALNALKSLQPSDQVHVLEKYKDATKESHIRNPSAFLLSIIKRIVESSARNKTFEDLPDSVQQALEEVFADGKLTKDAFISKSLEPMHCVSEPIMIEALKKYKDYDRNSIQNPEGFLNSIIRRLSNIERRGGDGQPPAEVRERIKEAISSGKIKDGDLDSRCMEALAEFDSKIGLEIVEQFLASDLTSVRNKGGFFFGIVKRFKRDPSDRRGGSKRSGGGGGGRRGGGGGGRDRYDDYDRYDRRGGGGGYRDQRDYYDDYRRGDYGREDRYYDRRGGDDRRDYYRDDRYRDSYYSSSAGGSGRAEGGPEYRSFGQGGDYNRSGYGGR